MTGPALRWLALPHSSSLPRRRVEVGVPMLLSGTEAQFGKRFGRFQTLTGWRHWLNWPPLKPATAPVAPTRPHPAT